MEYTNGATIATRRNTAQSLPVVWLWIRALNPDSLAAILQTPVPNENGMADKLIITKFYRGEVPLTGQESPDARTKRLEILKDQLPHFAHYLINEFPDERQQELLMQPEGGEYRNQAHPFVHPELLELLQSSENDSMKKSVAIDLLEAAIEDCEEFIGDEFDGNGFCASELHRIAVANSAIKNSYPTKTQQAAAVFANTFKSPASAGRILAQMADDPSEVRITCRKQSHRRFYTVNLPYSLP